MNAPAAEDAALIATLRRDVQALAGDIGARAIYHGDSLARAAEHIARRLAEAGWIVQRQVFPVGNWECVNLEAGVPGRCRPEEIVIVGAHYDTVGTTPGADDNASAVAALLALAGEFARTQPERTLRFVAFANEEPPYFQTRFMGSRIHARACRQRGERIVAMLALESIGYFSDTPGSQKYPFPLGWFYPSRGNFVAVVGNWASRALVRQVAATFRATETLPCESAALPDVIPGIGWSDHWAFWQEGFPAVMITGTATYRNPHYHEPTDKPDTLDYVRLAAAVRGLRAVVAELAGTPRR
jgi:Zn-dependent M28 family amino/carboxypeptidase